MRIPFSPPDITQMEIDEVVDTLKSGWITTGPKTKRLENEIANYCRNDKSVCLSSATAGLELTLRMLGIGKGDQVITTAYTYSASCSVIFHVGAEPILVDTKKDSYEMDYDLLEELISNKTKAIIAVDIAGVLCDYERIFEIVKKKKNLFKAESEMQEKFNRIIVIADSAHGFGAEKDNKKSGELADFTVFSFHAVKNLTTAEGGAVTWKKNEILNSDEIYKRYQILSLHGQTKDALSKSDLGSWEYDIIEPAYKFNMTDINAAIGLSQFFRYSDMIARRKEIIKKYDAALKDLPVRILKHDSQNYKSSGHLYLLRINNIDEEKRNKFIHKLAERGIATNVHYKPLPMLTAYINMGFNIKDFPNSYDMYKNEITLPLYSKLTDEEVDYVINNFKEVIRGELG